jgi:ADP-ribose pyrophosphatase
MQRNQACAGSCELGEEPLHGAQRELAEEVGLNATTWESLGQGRGSAALSSMYHLFLARGLSPTADGPMTEGAERDLTAHRVPFTLAVEAAFDGRIAHAVSAVALLRAARRLGCAQVLALTWRGGSDLQSRASTQP